LEPFLKPPAPPVNPFIKHRNGTPLSKAPVKEDNSAKDQTADKYKIKVGSSKKLIRPLLAARVEATAALSGYFTELVGSTEGKIAVELLRRKGALLNNIEM
jgi:hypothetical protein